MLTRPGPFRRGRLTLVALVAVMAAVAIFAAFAGDAAAQSQTYTAYILTHESEVVEGEIVGFRVLTSPRPPKDLKVQIKLTQDGNFAAGGELGTRTVTVTNRGYGVYQVRTIDDSVNEPAGTITAALLPGSNYQAGGDDGRYRSASSRVLDNDVPVVQISAGSAISEGGTANFTLRARPAPASPFQVEVTVAQSGDFAGSSELGQRTVNIDTNGNGVLNVNTESDEVDEDDGTITATLNAGTSYQVGSSSTGQVEVSDGGAPTPRVSVSAPASIEEGKTITFTVTGSPAPATPVTVRVNLAEQGSFATAGEISDRSVTLGTGGSATFTVATANDRAVEPDGLITATVAPGAGYLAGSPSQAEVSVWDATPTVTVAPGSSINEGETATFTLTATPALSTGLDVNIAVIQNGDFVYHQSDLGPRVVSIGANGSGTFTIDTYDDTTLENNGAIIVMLLDGRGYGVGDPNTASVSVADTTPLVSIAAGPTIIEGANATFTLTADPIPAATLYVDVRVSETGSFAGSGETGSRSVTIDATTGQGVLTVATDDDQSDEPNGSVTAQVEASGQSPPHYVPESTQPASVTVNDNDDDGQDTTVKVSVGDATVEESSAPRGKRTFIEFPVTVNRSGSWTSVKFEIRTTKETDTTAPATWEVDFGLVHPSQRLVTTFIAGQAVMLSLEVLDDDEYEPKPETFELVITMVNPGEIIKGRATGTITDDPLDAPRGTPVVSVSRVSREQATEGDDVTFELSANPMPKHDLEVTVDVSDDTGDDFLATGQKGDRVVTLKGVNNALFKYLGGTQTERFTVSTEDDALWEEDGSIQVTVQSDPDRNAGGEYDVSSDQHTATANVRDNDRGTPVVTITKGYDDPVEEGQSATFTLRAEPAPAQDLDVTVNVQDLSGDFVADDKEGDRTVTIPGVSDAAFALQRHTTHTMTVATVDDNVVEAAGQIRATIQQVSDNSYHADVQPYSATADVKDNDTPKPVISVTGGSGITEGGSASFTVSASPAPSANLDVKVTITQSGDYGATTGQRTVTIPTSGSVTFTVGTTDDSADEADGSVTATVDAGSGYTVSSSQGAATVSVADNDNGPDYTDYQTLVDHLIEIRDNPENTAVKGNPAHIRKWNRVLAAIGYDSGESPMPESEIHANAAKWPESSFKLVSDYLKLQAGQPEISVSGGSGVTEGGDASFTVSASPAPSADLDVKVTVTQSGDYGATTGQRTVTIPTSGSVTFTVGTTDDQTDETDGAVTATVDAGSGYTVSSSQGAATVSVAD
ncbi:MAG: hypothetical protein OXO53_03485, partial [Chloroflexota bacterium]|nr:hypothetical protein [Chloroflexota bacterium]